MLRFFEITGHPQRERLLMEEKRVVRVIGEIGVEHLVRICKPLFLHRPGPIDEDPLTFGQL